MQMLSNVSNFIILMKRGRESVNLLITNKSVEFSLLLLCALALKIIKSIFNSEFKAHFDNFFLSIAFNQLFIIYYLQQKSHVHCTIFFLAIKAPLDN